MTYLAAPVQQPERKRGKQVMLGDALKAFLKDSGLDHRMRHSAVMEAWNSALGTERCKRARAIQFREGHLVVETDSAAQRHELASFSGESYRKEANRILGSNRILKITYKLKH